MIPILQGLLTPVIAFLGLYIAYQQYVTSRAKYRLDRYEKAVGIYTATIEFLSKVMQHANVEYDEIAAYRLKTAQAYFILGPELSSYIEQISMRAIKLKGFKSMYRDFTQEQPPGYNHAAVVDGMHEQIKWISEQFDLAKEKFSPQLDISDGALLGLQPLWDLFRLRSWRKGTPV